MLSINSPKCNRLVIIDYRPYMQFIKLLLYRSYSWYELSYNQNNSTTLSIYTRIRRREVPLKI